MKSHIKTIKNAICYLVAFILVLTANIGLMTILKPSINTVHAFKGHSNMPLDNQNFDSETGDYPIKPKYYTPSTEIDDANVNAGIINLNETEYQKYPKNSLSKDNFVLMIDSDGNTDANFGYTSDDDIELAANGYYSVSVDVHTSNSNGIATISLTEDGKNFASLDNKSSVKDWTTYSFFIRTSNLEATTLKLGLYLDGDGVVLFDNISIDKLNKDTFMLRKSQLSNTQYSYIDLVDNIVAEHDLSDKPFDKTYANNDTIAYTTAEYVDTNAETAASDGANTTAFKITNHKSNAVEYATEDDYFSFDMNTIQKVTVRAKAVDLAGKASLQLVETGLSKDDTAHNLTAISITSDTKSELELDNDFVDYSFYIKGYPTKVAQYKLVVSLGASDNLTTGTLYISNITISKVTDSIFTAVNTGSTAEKQDLTADYVFTGKDFILNNGNFNGIKIENHDKTYPAEPANWTATQGTNNQQYGVVNTTKLSELNLATLNATAVNNGSNNVLMMYNETGDVLSYKSETKSLDPKTYHKFSLDVHTQNALATISLVTSKNETEIVLASKTIDTEYEWKTVDFYLYTGYQMMDVALKVTLDTTDTKSYGYAFVDNAMFNYYTQPTADEFSEKQDLQSPYMVTTDLSKMIVASSDNHYSTPLHFTGSGDEIAYSGVVYLDGSELQNYVIENAEDVTTFKSLTTDNRYVLAIRSLNDAKYTFTSNIGYKLNANKEYMISVSVYTNGLQILAEDADQDKKGASIGLTGFDESFTRIVSDNEWTTYTFYVCPNNDITTYLELSLGGDVKCTGDVFFGNIVFKDENLPSFDSLESDPNQLVLKSTSTEADDSTDDTEDSSDTDTEKKSNNAWIIAIPSILFALSIIICIAGVAMRKVKFKKPRQKKSKTSYDRNKTVSKQIYMRKATTLREEKIREANKQLEELHSQRAKYEDEYKHGIAKLRELKLKRVTGSEVNKLEKDIKRNQKSSAAIGLNIARLENDVEYMKSDSYLNSLMKKLANEKAESQETDN